MEEGLEMEEGYDGGDCSVLNGDCGGGREEEVGFDQEMEGCLEEVLPPLVVSMDAAAFLETDLDEGDKEEGNSNELGKILDDASNGVLDGVNGGELPKVMGSAANGVLDGVHGELEGLKENLVMDWRRVVLGQTSVGERGCA